MVQAIALYHGACLSGRRQVQDLASWPLLLVSVFEVEYQVRRRMLALHKSLLISRREAQQDSGDPGELDLSGGM